MQDDLRARCDAALLRATEGPAPLPGVVAAVVDRAGTIYAGAAGARDAGGAAMTTDTVLALFSMSKAVTATLCLQLAEESRLDLDAPARLHAPDLGAAMVVEGFDDAGRPRLRPPAREVTTRMLLLHTAGFGYDMFDATCLRMTMDCGLPRTVTATRASLQAPLVFDPGARWQYGISIDWAGLVVEGVLGRRLGEAMAERVFAPLGMASTAFRVSPEMETRRAGLWRRNAAGGLAPIAAAPLADPEVDMGGQGLWGTAADYARFVRMWLAEGMGEHGRVLRPETVRMALRDGLDGRPVTPLRGVVPGLSHDFELFPGMHKGWGLSFLTTKAPAPTGRAAGSIGWCGLANLHWWADPATGIGGVWATQLLPFADPAALAGFLDFETEVYAGLAA